MRAFLLSFLLILTAAVSLTFGGMVLMDHDGMMMPGDDCMVGTCTTSRSGDTDDATCISQCIRATTMNSMAPASANVQVLLIFFVSVLFVNLFAPQVISRFFRSDNDIEKILLHRQLSTVIIRD